MKILIDIGHPAHVHFFYHPIRNWLRQGCQVVVTSRHKEMAIDLLDALGVKHQPLSTMNKGSVLGMAQELLQRDCRLLHIVRHEKPDILIGIGGIFVAHVGFLTRIPSLVFYDTENASLSNIITYPVCSLVVVPSCYKAWLPSSHLKYPGYHELSYLHPDVFQPEKDIAVQFGLHEKKKNFLIRTVSWQANHDIAEKKWSTRLLKNIVQFLAGQGNVIISAEGELPDELEQYAFTGPPEKIHHLMGFLDLFVGESATMASECAVLGVPAIYLAATGRGYTDEQEEKYGLVFNVKTFEWEVVRNIIEEVLSVAPTSWKRRQQKMLNSKIEVSGFVTELVLNYPDSVMKFRNKFAKSVIL